MIAAAARLALTGALLSTAALAAATSAQAEPVTPELLSWLASQRDRGSQEGQRLSASATGLVPMSATCPRGQMVGTVYDAESFESGVLPDPGFSEGWTVATGDGASGSKYATSTLTPDGTIQASWVATVEAAVPASGSLYASFAYRGTPGDGIALADVNGMEIDELTAGAEWAYRRLDVTAARSDDGVFYLDAVLLLPDTAAAASTLEIDDVRLYSCVPIPNAGVRGDWTGEGTVDLLGTHSTGDLYLYPGKGNGAVGSGVAVGPDWGGFTWQGSPGDVTGDRRTDLLGRRADGSLALYAGRGGGGFASAVTVGQGWGAMTALATPGDLTLDGRPELVGRRSDGTLHLYSFTSTGGLRWVKQIGSGWNGMAWVIGMGDLNGDKRGDIVAVGSDGCIYSYATTSVATLRLLRKLGCGWRTMNWLTSPGDLDRDGYGDLVARDADGRLWFYSGLSGGGVEPGVQVGSGWQGMARIL